MSAPSKAGVDAHVNVPTGRRLAWLTLGALGIVFGDLGTSPLYALQECFGGAYPISAPCSERYWPRGS